MAAAASASADGAKVLVLEKTGAIGGNTKLGEGTYNSSDSSRQKNIEMNDSNRKEIEEATIYGENQSYSCNTFN